MLYLRVFHQLPLEEKLKFKVVRYNNNNEWRDLNPDEGEEVGLYLWYRTNKLVGGLFQRYCHRVVKDE